MGAKPKNCFIISESVSAVLKRLESLALISKEQKEFYLKGLEDDYFGSEEEWWKIHKKVLMYSKKWKQT